MEDGGELFKGTMLWPHPASGPWAVTVEWRMQYGVPTPVGLQIRSYLSHDEIRAHLVGVLPNVLSEQPFERMEGRVLKALPISEVLNTTLAKVRDDARLRLAQIEAEGEFAYPPDVLALLGGLDVAVERLLVAASLPDTGKNGRDLGDAHYAEVAAVYRAAAGTGAPTKAVAEHFKIEKSSAAKQVARARQRGFLPPTSRGRVGRGQEKP